MLAEGIREAYEDLFRVNRNAQDMSTSDVKNKMKTLSEASPITSTFSYRNHDLDGTEVAEALSFELFDEDLLKQARLMSTVYTAISTFEMSVRRFVKRVLMDTYGEGWWEKSVSEKIRKFVDGRRADEESERSNGGCE